MGDKQYISVTREQAVALLASERCVCGAAKRRGDAFCVTDWLALPLYLRTWLAKGADSEYFAENYRRAWQHLVDLGGRRREHIGAIGDGAPTRWRYNSESELEAAGYRLAGSGAPERCAAPGCNQPIRWYLTPHKKRLAINFAQDDVRPHFMTCADPSYFKFRSERRRLRTSARRRRRA